MQNFSALMVVIKHISMPKMPRKKGVEKKSMEKLFLE